MSTRQDMPRLVPRTEPGISSGSNPGSDSVALRDAVYRCLQLAVEAFELRDVNGQVTQGAPALAEAMGAARSDTYLRVQRKEDTKGALQRAFLDYLGPLLAHLPSRRVFVEQLLAQLDYEPPVSRRRVTDEDVGRAAADWVRSLPPSMRAAAAEDIARSLGVRATDVLL